MTPLPGEPSHPGDTSEPLVIVTDEVLTGRAFGRLIEGWDDVETVVILGEGQRAASMVLAVGMDAAVTVSKVTDAVKLVDAEGRIDETLDRERLRHLSLPMVMRIGSVRAALSVRDPDQPFDPLALIASSDLVWRVSVLNPSS
jgi:hypothetical protein